MSKIVKRVAFVIPLLALYIMAGGFDGAVAADASEDSTLTAAPALSGELVRPTEPENPTFGELDPGRGFLIARTDMGELGISAYGVLKYTNQLPAGQTWTDHNGNEHDVLARHDIYSHRILVFFKGWAFTRKFLYSFVFWTVNTTDQKNIFADFGYQFHKKFNLFGGIGGNPGTRSIMGSHPYWLAHDRVMADEFFRPYFSFGVWANGELFPGFFYSATVGNSSSILGVKASTLDRKFTYGGTLWYMPTTKEFGPRGGYGDYAWHEKVATRFGISSTFSPEQRFSEPTEPAENTILKLADGLNVFDTGALAEGVTVNMVDYTILGVDAAMKYKGVFLHAEYYWRRLENFVADGALPQEAINDNGFHVQAAFFPVKQKLELYTATSQIYGDKDAGFSNSSEYLVGLNFYPGKSRDLRVNVQFIDVDNSPVGSTFGYYSAGHDGQVITVATSLFF